MRLSFDRIPLSRQYLLSAASILGVTLIGLVLHDFLGYQVVAFLLLVTVSVLSVFMDIRPVMASAIMSALLWDFLFIPPRFTFSVGTTEDRWLLLMYFVVATIHAVLTFRIRQMEREVRAREEKARAIKFYDAVFNSLSHELRTPITAILAATDNLSSDNEKIGPQSRKDLLNEIASAAIRLNRQVENLLSMSRLESGALKIKKDWCDVREIVYAAVEPLENVKSHKITISVAENLPLFKLDFALIEQALYNLVSNAIQHTPEGTDILVNADIAEERLLLTVSDTGKGFPEGDIKKVFDKFYRVEGSRAGGTGLGLSIVRGFVEAHQGTVSLRNLPLSGAEFTISIPAEVTYVNRLKNE